MTGADDRLERAVDPDVLDAVSTLTIEVRRVVEGLQGGGHASMHQGASVEFAEHKKYYPGDDIRHIDWKALARTDRFFIKTHEREVTLRCLMLLDCSASMGFRGSRAPGDKLGFAKVLLGAIAHILVRQGDGVGLLPFAETPHDFLPPDRRPEHLPAFFSRLVETRAAEGGETGFVEALQQAADRAGRRAMIVVATDLWGAGRKTEIALASLAARGHDVALFHVLAPDELDLPYQRTTTFVGPEGEKEITINPALIREDYREAVRAEMERWRQIAGRAGIDLVQAISGSAPEVVLAEFAARRHRTVRV